MNKALFALAILFGSLMYPLYGTDITFINSDNETKTIDIDQDGIMCIPGLDLDDKFVYEFISNEQTSKEIPWKKINGCFINKRDWLHAIGQASEVRTRWLNRALDFSGKEIASINVYQLIEEGAYLLTQTIDTQINSNRIACAPEQHRLPEEALNPAQVADALGEHVAIPQHHFLENEHINGHPIAAHHANAVLANGEILLIQSSDIGTTHFASLTEEGHAALVALPVPNGVRTEIWNSVMHNLTQNSIIGSIYLQNREVTTPELVAIMRTIPQQIRNEIYSLNLDNNQLDELPTEVAQLPRLKYLHVENNHLAQLPNQIVQRIQTGELYSLHDNHNQIDYLATEGLEAWPVFTAHVPEGIRPTTWFFIAAQLRYGNSRLNLSGRSLKTSELLAIIQALPQHIKDSILELQLSSNNLESIPQQIVNFPQLRILDTRGNYGIRQIAPEVLEREHNGQLILHGGVGSAWADWQAPQDWVAS